MVVCWLELSCSSYVPKFEHTADNGVSTANIYIVSYSITVKMVVR